MQEIPVHRYCYFTTLTYDNNHVPRDANNMLTLNLVDMTKFWKRLRKNSGLTISYFYVGEYGTSYWRPHYHAIIFCNQPIEHSMIHKSWGLGQVDHGYLGDGAIPYALKYISKDKRIPRFRDDLRKPEFRNMSKHLGMSYVTPRSIKYHQSDLFGRYYLTLPGGIKLPMPRYYKSKLYTPEQQILLQRHFEEMEEMRLMDGMEKHNYDEMVKLDLTKRKQPAHEIDTLR